MIFNRVILNNFRQYKGKVEIDLSTDINKPITLVVGNNGSGKTTLLQSIRYCFYGSSSNYLNLPKSDEMLNTSLSISMKELDLEEVFVEVHFTHKNTYYIARRKRTYKKIRDSIEPGSEQFSMKFQLKGKPFIEMKSEDASDKIRSIIPDGLSYIFMFDGERMEKKLNERQFQQDLKESILGMLDIKKYDKLYSVLGSENKSSTVIGMLESKKIMETKEQKEARLRYKEILEKYEGFKIQITEQRNQLTELDKEIEKYKDNQQKIQQTQKLRLELSSNELKLISDQEKLEFFAADFIKTSKYALTHKLVLKFKNKYDKFLLKQGESKVFYSYLHVSTIEDIIDKKICVCGRPFSEHSAQEKHLESLKETALPIESAQNLNLINQKIKEAASFNDEMKALTEKKDFLNNLKKSIRDNEAEIKRLERLIKENEQLLGLGNQLQIESLYDNKNVITNRISELSVTFNALSAKKDQMSAEIKEFESKSSFNNKLNQIIDDMLKVKKHLLDVKDDKDSIARNVLTLKFNDILTRTIQKKYKVDIMNDYSIVIRNIETGKDETDVLSTGQRVVVSVSFINALIQTAKELSPKIEESERYGVLMDAALSNLDDLHIDRMCDVSLNSFDQLLFLSFKKTLKGELFDGIEQRVGKVFNIVLDKVGNARIVTIPTEKDKLRYFINEMSE
jgi:DNA sulfur modification protein DndD